MFMSKPYDFHQSKDSAIGRSKDCVGFVRIHLAFSMEKADIMASRLLTRGKNAKKVVANLESEKVTVEEQPRAITV
jgi:hypothetical protein